MAAEKEKRTTMTPNPYEPPRAYGAPTSTAMAMNRGPFLLAAIGAWFAGAYWAAITLLLTVGVAAGSMSSTQLVLPCILIALYAYRGYQIFNGDPAAARRVLWLHGVGSVAAILQMQSSRTMSIMVILQGIKVLIHIFGGITAYQAQKVLATGPSQ
jgi:hypothetical protein